MSFELLPAILKRVYEREVNNQVPHGICPNASVASIVCTRFPLKICDRLMVIVSVARIELESISDDWSFLSQGSSWVIARAFPYDRPCRFQKFEATETIQATGTTIWKPGFTLPRPSHYLLPLLIAAENNRQIRELKHATFLSHGRQPNMSCFPS